MVNFEATNFQINEDLVSDPSLLLNDPLGQGFIAIVLLKRPRKGKRWHDSVFGTLEIIHRAPEEIVEDDQSANQEETSFSAETTLTISANSSALRDNSSLLTTSDVSQKSSTGTLTLTSNEETVITGRVRILKI